MFSRAVLERRVPDPLDGWRPEPGIDRRSRANLTGRAQFDHPGTVTERDRSMPSPDRR